MKRIISVLLVVTMVFAGSVLAFAADLTLNTNADVSSVSGEAPFAVANFAGGTAGSYAQSGVLLLQKGEEITVLGTDFSNPTGLTVDDAGNLYVSETDNGRIVKITADRKASEYQTGLLEPMGLCWANGKLYVAESGKNRIVCLDGTNMTVVAGKEIKDTDDEYAGAHVNGKIEDTEFDHPQGVCVLKDGRIFVADTNNHAIRMLKDGKSYSVLVNRDLSGNLIKPAQMWEEDGILYINDTFSGTVITYDTNEDAFADVKSSDWFASYVNEAVLMGITNGVDDNHFAPSANVSRAQFACMIARVALYRNGSLVIAGDSTFDDLAEDTWYTDEVKWAADKTVVQGYAGKFSPNDNVTRQDLITMLYRYAKAEDIAPEALASLHGYAGTDDLAAYAEDAMSWAISAGLIDGRPCEVDEENGIYFGDLAPKGTATRAEAVKILVSFLNKPY